MNILETLIQLRDDIKEWVTNNLVALDAKIESKTIPIDSELNTESTNPIQNKAIATKIEEVEQAIEDATNSNITDDGSGEFNIADPSGNVIMKVDADGIHTTDIEVNGTSIADKILVWDAKSDFSGDYNDLSNKPNIVDDGSDNYVIADNSGNVIFKVDADGVHTTDVTFNDTSLSEKMSEWDAKSDFSGDYNDLTNAPNITEDESGEVVYADEDGNIIAKINADGFETTKVIADDVVVGGESVKTELSDLGSAIDAHTEDADIHITTDERAAWDAKSDADHTHTGYLHSTTTSPDGNCAYTALAEITVSGNGNHSQCPIYFEIIDSKLNAVKDEIMVYFGDGENPVAWLRERCEYIGEDYDSTTTVEPYMVKTGTSTYTWKLWVRKADSSNSIIYVTDVKNTNPNVTIEFLTESEESELYADEWGLSYAESEGWNSGYRDDIDNKAPKASPVFTGSVSLGRKSSTTVGNGSLAVGYDVEASGVYSQAIGYDTQATAEAAHAEGKGTNATNAMAHAEGYYTTASGSCSHAEGFCSEASGIYSHAEGKHTIAGSGNQHVQGRFNISDTSDVYAHIVGNGTDVDSRSNAHTIDWDGNGWFAGDIYVGGTGQDDADAVNIITEIDNLKKSVVDGKTLLVDAINETGGLLTSDPSEYTFDTLARGIYDIAEVNYRTGYEDAGSISPTYAKTIYGLSMYNSETTETNNAFATSWNAIQEYDYWTVTVLAKAAYTSTDLTPLEEQYIHSACGQICSWNTLSDDYYFRAPYNDSGKYLFEVCIYNLTASLPTYKVINNSSSKIVRFDIIFMGWDSTAHISESAYISDGSNTNGTVD